MCNETTKTCSRCGLTGDLDLFQPHHNYHANSTKTITRLNICKKCSNKEAWQRQKAIKFTDPVKYYTEALWKTLNQRCINGLYANSYSIQASKQMQSYHSKNIMLLLSKDDLYNFLKSQEDIMKKLIESGETPSLDRIDDTKNYELGNIQVISRRENIHKSKGYAAEPKNVDPAQKKIENQKYYKRSKENFKKKLDGAE